MSEMQEAGYILLMPGGDWNANTAYHILHLVNHNGASWVCKKDCTGQEPSDSNTEFWQRFGTAVDLSNYLKNTGGTIDGNLKVSTSEDAYRVFTLKNGTREIEFAVYAGGAFRVMDITNNKLILLSNAEGKTTLEATASGNVPITGGEVTGTFKAKAGSEYPLRAENQNSKNAYTAYYGIDGGWLGSLGFSEYKAMYRNTSGEGFALYHERNKPIGTYTGNGDATERQIATGSLFPCYIVSSPNGIAIVTADGCFGGDGSTVIRDTRAYASGSNIVLKSSSALLNASGVTYKYYTV